MIVQNRANDAYRLPVMGSPQPPAPRPREAGRRVYWRTIDLRVVGWLVWAITSIPVQVAGTAAGVTVFVVNGGYTIRLIDRLLISIIVAPCTAMIWGWVKQFSLWSSDKYAKAREFVYAHLFLRCSKGVAEARRMVCERCSMRTAKPDKRAKMHSYCGQCNCGHHRAARLSWKVRLAGFSCPMGKFSDSPTITKAVILFWVSIAAAVVGAAWTMIVLFGR